jgi:hypothetical protein
LDYYECPAGYLKFIYTSPKTKDMLVKTIEIIDKLKPKYWFIDSSIKMY